jgi:hypothetical protein
MKTLFMMLFMGFAFLLPTENPTDTSTLEKTDYASEHELGQLRIIKGVSAWGRKRKNCTGLGICYIGVGSANTNKGRRTFFGFNGKTLIYISWKKSDISKEDQAKYMKEGIFVIEEDVNETVESDDEKFQVNLKAGKYQLKEDKEGFLLEVTG